MDTDVPPILLPCAICARTFMPQSLEKHTKICERAATKKRKPFDSAKQRIQGTDLAEFLPIQQQQKKRSATEERISIGKPNSTWKQTHNEFLKAIRQARGESIDFTTQKQTSSPASYGAPMRANEKGMCPTCNRYFGIKAYDRHVAWCKERSTRLPISPATNVAKERLEARIKYRAPALRNRRPTNREKYSPSSAVALNVANNKTSPPLNNAKAKESISIPSCNKGNCNPIKQKAAVVRRVGQIREPSSGPMKSRPADRTNSGTCKDYDPFLLAEQQMNDLLSDSSDLSATDGGALPFKLDRALLPLSHSSAFIKYPHQRSVPPNLDKRTSLIAPPSEFDDLTSDFSSDSTETNSLSREIFLKDHRQGDLPREAISKTSETSRSSVRELGRRMIIDKSKALGGEVVEDRARRDSGDDGIKDTTSSSNIERTRKSAEKASTKATKPAVNRSHSVRASSAPKSTPERKNLVVKKTLASFASATVDNDSQKHANTNHSNKRNNNNYVVLAGSNLSLSSIVSSETDVKRSNSMFDELMTSFEDDGISFPSLRSFLKNESLSMSSPVHGCTRQINGQISDEELSSPDSYKRQDHKLSADSAYSSLNRKYFNHGRSANDMIDRINDQTSTTIYRDGYAISSASKAKCKLSKFCHECGSKFPETAKFCCQCGVKRLTF